MAYFLTRFSLIFLLGILNFSTFASEFSLPSPGNNLIGSVQYATASYGDTTTTIAHHYNLGLNSLIAANPGTTETRLRTFGC